MVRTSMPACSVAACTFPAARRVIFQVPDLDPTKPIDYVGEALCFGHHRLVILTFAAFRASTRASIDLVLDEPLTLSNFPRQRGESA